MNEQIPGGESAARAVLRRPFNDRLLDVEIRRTQNREWMRSAISAIGSAYREDARELADDLARQIRGLTGGSRSAHCFAYFDKLAELRVDSVRDREFVRAEYRSNLGTLRLEERLIEKELPAALAAAGQQPDPALSPDGDAQDGRGSGTVTRGFAGA